LKKPRKISSPGLKLFKEFPSLLSGEGLGVRAGKK
jgi:hypothetical protein